MGHIHAELMAQYAEDAKEHDRPWKLWQRRDSESWVDCASHPGWYRDSQYRRKPRTVKISGIEVPESCKSEALRLADLIDSSWPQPGSVSHDAAAELRRLHERDTQADAQIKELLQVIEDLERGSKMLSQRVQELESIERQLCEQADVAANAYRELERELAAIGAGGVEPLRKTSADTSALRAALEEAEAALEVATSRLSARGANYPVHVTSEARALEIVRKALGKSQPDHFRDATKMMLPTAQNPDDARDAARYRWLRTRWGRIADEYDGDSNQLVAIREADSRFEGWDVDPLSLDRAIDAARRITQEKQQ